MSTKTTYTTATDRCNQHDVNYWDCGHKHRTVEAAVKCLAHFGNDGRSYHANIVDSAGNLWDRNGYPLAD